MSVGRRAVPDDLRDDLRAPALGALPLFQNQHGRPVAHDEAVAVLVERPAGGLGIVVALRQRLHVREAGERERRDRRLRSARDHDPEHLFWLLSDASLWLPQKIRDVLQMGMCALGNRWMWYEGRDELGEWATKGTLARAIQDAEHDRKAFVLTDEAFDDLKHRARNAKRLLRLPESQDELVRRFIDGNVVTRFLESVKEVRQPIKKKSP